VNTINEKFSSSKWYQNIIFYLQNLQCPPNLTPPKTISLKLKVVKYCIINEQLYWRYPLGFLLTCLIESETKNFIDEFHKGICGGHPKMIKLT